MGSNPIPRNEALAPRCGKARRPFQGGGDTVRHRSGAPAMRMWCSGSTPASQAGDRGFESRHPLYPGALVFDVFHPPIPCRGPRRRTDARRGPPIRAVRPFSSAVRTADF